MPERSSEYLQDKYGSQDRERIREVASDREQAIQSDPNFSEDFKKAAHEVHIEAIEDVGILRK